MAAEYVLLKASHPTYLNLQMPTEVGELIRYDVNESKELHPPSRGISFLARGPGVVRVLPTLRAGEVLPIEAAHNRYLATALLSGKLVFTIPEAVIRHLGLKVQLRAGHGTRFTDDGLVWFLPAPEYYEFRARERTGKGWTGPASGGFAHVYAARAVLPLDSELDLIERRIDHDEWRPRLEALDRLARGRRSSTG